ncbi:Heat shock protein 70 1 [Diplonema papillatum]|nr:Heat shock protein 70 1 [Diplonema papillatum]
MVSASDIGCSVFILVVIGPIALQVLPWWEFASETQLGIDLGTTFSVASTCNGGVPTAVIVDDNTPLVPSIVSYFGGDVRVGFPAHTVQLEHPEAVVTSAKRFIGKKVTDESVQEEARELPFQIVEGRRGEAGVVVEGVNGVVMPEDVGGAVLKKLKAKAEASAGYWKHLMGFKFYTATITVPVSFGGPERAATHRAALLAGFSMVRLIEEPVAAAIAYGLQNRERCDVLVYDMGGGTLDVALLRLQEDTRTFLLLATTGDSHLGGSDFDRCLVHHLADKHDINLSQLSAHDRAVFTDTVEHAKRNLSIHESVTFTAPWGDAVTISNSDISTKCKDLVDRSIVPIDDILQVSLVPESGLEVVLAGGSSRLLAIRRLLKDRFGADRVHSSLDADLAISLGASRAYGC